uniref:Uncharacterized protein n=1 Tax=Anguilla anguilla TaxID=7936 RepID=A0A0E9RUP0_ANGAN
MGTSMQIYIVYEFLFKERFPLYLPFILSSTSGIPLCDYVLIWAIF